MSVHPGRINEPNGLPLRDETLWGEAARPFAFPLSLLVLLTDRGRTTSIGALHA